MVIDIFKAIFSGSIFFKIFSTILFCLILVWVFWGIREAKQKEIKEFQKARPSVSIGNKYEANGNIFVISIKTEGNNSEIIEHMVIRFSMEGIISNVRPGLMLGSSSLCKNDLTNGLILGDELVYHNITLKYDQILPGILNNTLIDFEKMNRSGIKINDRISVEWYWKYKGETKHETKWLERNYAGKNCEYIKL